MPRVAMSCLAAGACLAALGCFAVAAAAHFDTDGSTRDVLAFTAMSVSCLAVAFALNAASVGAATLSKEEQARLWERQMQRARRAPQPDKAPPPAQPPPPEAQTQDDEPHWDIPPPPPPPPRL